jgi:hypothetical protein
MYFSEPSASSGLRLQQKDIIHLISLWERRCRHLRQSNLKEHGATQGQHSIPAQSTKAVVRTVALHYPVRPPIQPPPVSPGGIPAGGAEVTYPASPYLQAAVTSEVAAHKVE